MSMSKKTFILIYDPPPPGFVGRETGIRMDTQILNQNDLFRVI